MRKDAPEVRTAPASFLIDSASAFCGEKEPSFAERVAFLSHHRNAEVT
jgi:hypothetical protein